MSSQGSLGAWYRKNLGEPMEDDHVYGYWAFLVGSLLALVGLLVYLYSATIDPTAAEIQDTAWTERAIAASAAMVGGGLIFYAVVLLLPLQKRAAQVSGVGFLLTLVATALFNVWYPSNWYWAGADPDRSPLVLGIYSAGIIVMIASIFLYPLLTSETQDVPMTVEEVEEEEPAPPESKGTFELYQDKRDEWRWRLVHDNGNIIADSGEGYSSKAKARQGLESVRKNAPGAGEDTLEREVEVVDDAEDEDAADAEDETDDEDSEFEFGAAGEGDEEAAEAAPSQARFEVYEDRGGEYRWRLRHTNGNIVADGGEGYSSRSGLDDAVERIQTVAGEADTLDYEPAAYELYEDKAEEWRWRLRHKNGRILADSGEGYASRSNARRAIESVRENAGGAGEFEVYEDEGGKYRWRLLADNGEIVADSGQGYSRESSARDAVERTENYAPESDTLDYEPAAYELFQDRADEWRWRLRHRNGNILADSGEGYSSKSKAKQGMRSVINNAPGAEVQDVEN